MKRIFLGMGCLFFFQTFAQVTVDEDAFGYYVDAYRFSKQDIVGSARTMGFGGAQIAVGGDNSSAVINPGGLGLFRKSDWSLTLRSNNTNYDSDFISSISSSTNRSNYSKTTVPNVSFVFSDVDDSPEADWKGQTFAMSVIRTNDYNSEYIYSGTNAGSRSFRSFLADNAYGINYSSLEAGLNVDNNTVDDRLSAAYHGWLINAIDESGTDEEQSTFYTLDDGGTDEFSEIVRESGGTTKWNFAYAGNYQDKLYVGVNVGLQTLKWGSERLLTESPSDQSSASVQSVIYDEEILSKGNAFHVSLGGIYKVDDNWRFGLSYHLPSTIKITEEYIEKLSINYNNVDANVVLPTVPPGLVILTYESFSSPTYEFTYSLKMPSKTSLGTSYFFEKKGFVALDVDYTPMHQANLSASQFDFVGDNITINNIYKPKLDIRVGGELRMENIFIRGGYQHQGNPYRKDFEVTSLASNVYTTGIGYRSNEFYADLAIIHQRRDIGYSPFTFSGGGQPVVYTAANATGWMASFGLLF